MISPLCQYVYTLYTKDPDKSNKLRAIPRLIYLFIFLTRRLRDSLFVDHMLAFNDILGIEINLMRKSRELVTKLIRK